MSFRSALAGGLREVVVPLFFPNRSKRCAMITSSRCAGLLRPSWAPNYGNFTGPLGSFSGGFLFPGAIKLDPNFDDAGEQQLFALSLAAVANLPAFSEARDNSYPLPPSLRGWRIWTSAAVALLLVLAGIATWWLRGETAGYRSPSPAKTPETVRAAAVATPSGKDMRAFAVTRAPRRRGQGARAARSDRAPGRS